MSRHRRLPRSLRPIAYHEAGHIVANFAVNGGACYFERAYLRNVDDAIAEMEQDGTHTIWLGEVVGTTRFRLPADADTCVMRDYFRIDQPTFEYFKDEAELTIIELLCGPFSEARHRKSCRTFTLSKGRSCPHSDIATIERLATVFGDDPDDFCSFFLPLQRQASDLIKLNWDIISHVADKLLTTKQMSSEEATILIHSAAHKCTKPPPTLTTKQQRGK